MHDPRSYGSLSLNFKRDEGPPEAQRLAAEFARLNDAQ